MDAKQIISRLAELKAERSQFESQWNDIDERIAGPAMFNRENATPGEKRGMKMFDSTAMIGIDRFAATMSSLMTPQNEQWHKLEMEGESDHDAKVYTEEVTDIIFKARYASRSGFPSQIHEFYKGLARYGTAILAINDIQGIRYRNLSLTEICLEENWQGQVDTIYRRYPLTARQAVQQFREKTPEKIARVAETKPSEKFWFVQKVFPNKEVDPDRLDFKGMRFASYDICEQEQVIVDEGGYREFPFTIGRFSTSPGDVYGRSPIMQVLPTIKMLNAMKKTTLRAGDLATDPPLLTSNDGSLQAFQIRPGALIPGGMADGRQNVMPLQMGKNIPFSMEIMAGERKTINDALFVSLFEILAEDRRQMTAQEVLHRAQEKGDLLGPIAGELQVSVFGPMIERELDILEAARQLPKPPESVRLSGGYYKIQYTSPITRAQKAGEGIAVMRMVESTAAIAQFDPTAPKRVKWDVALQVLADAQGFPSKALRSDEEMKAIEEQEAQAQQVQQLLQAAPVAAQSAKYLAEAQSMSGSPDGGAF